jgi:TolA-binding protein
MSGRIITIGLMLPLCLAACGGSHSSSQPTATAEPGVLDSRMKEMQAELEQMRLQQQQMQQQQEQQRQQQLQLLYQQRQAAAAAGTAAPPPVPGAQVSAPPLPSANREVLPAFHWFDPSEPQQKPDVKNIDQKI